ncbi:hypothetical protein A2697_01585 [Candidatus Curtissbacteria bacterium RIFCSPHIGHO2_01_FULL_41_44]|uniref:Uncharacterized protein n=1 Tax=Candidatus Curtissbacteria bacterium RIFCSPLOWO2_01_FULL_42_50 TaxID=1797730 RepID=A0A1F5H624_9BACT|nr:MAG: hypothetical protein A2697_01585 [Candidatus Curtissbacteria bacterium RIFCSPHIGHO2_01_FULL_41_44]OGD99622.1 MAG: hypothetical protein A3B54_02960 [Candidatus Curtissbacteria bacterium RIFCSPLOWO2_01_FULL_42_50]
MSFDKSKKSIAIFSKSFLKEITKDPIYSLLILLVIIIAIFFRIYNYTDRVFIQADNSRDVQVARFAADNLKIPPIGQFSSAGPFFTVHGTTGCLKL